MGECADEYRCSWERDTKCPGNWSYSSCEPANVGCWELNTDSLQETAPALPVQRPPCWLFSRLHFPFPCLLSRAGKPALGGNPEPGRMAGGGGWLLYVLLWREQPGTRHIPQRCVLCLSTKHPGLSETSPGLLMVKRWTCEGCLRHRAAAQFWQREGDLAWSSVM